MNLENYIFENIPISLALGIKVEKLSKEEVIISAPILNNVNHKKTVFGGSLHAVTTLACWSLVYFNLQALQRTYEIVIAKSTIEYLLPVTRDFQARCSIPSNIDWQRFVKTLTRHGKARIELTATIHQENQLAVDYHGSFVAIVV